MASELLKKMLSRTKSVCTTLKHANNIAKAQARMIYYKTDEEVKPMTQLKTELMAIMGVERGYKPDVQKRTHLAEYIAKDIKELPPRKMGDSYLVGLIPLSSDVLLQEKYITFMGHLRMGRILEDMDIFAVMVAQKHILNPKIPKGVPSPYTLVTAHVDEIDFSEYVPKIQEDIKISGHVTFVGKSSMEVAVWLEQEHKGEWHNITRAIFSIVARDPGYLKSALVNPLVPETEHEKKIVHDATVRKKELLIKASKDLNKVIPTTEEQEMIHDLYIRTRQKDHNLVDMRKHVLSNAVFSHPEDRNFHNTVFGGFLMRIATELAWINAYQFSRRHPRVRCISDITFHKPIAVGSLLQMNSKVIYAQGNYFQSAVFVMVSDPVTGKSHLSNTFHFTFEVDEGGPLPELYPESYHGAMMYVDGRRHFLKTMKRLGKGPSKADCGLDSKL